MKGTSMSTTTTDQVSGKIYRLRAPDASTYETTTPGQLGGYAPGRIYGRLNCPSAKRHLANGNYVKSRVFFADEAMAIASGFRPCFYCMRERYKEWKAGGIPGTASYPWMIVP